MSAIVALPSGMLLPAGMLLPSSVLQSEVFAVLATFVALNTLMYATLALLKLLPKGYTFFWTPGRNRRLQNRSIHPDPPEPGPKPEPSERADAARATTAASGR